VVEGECVVKSEFEVREELAHVSGVGSEWGAGAAYALAWVLSDYVE